MADEPAPSYDDHGNWVREDRPELLSDRLGYPPSVGDEDWPRIKAAREQAAQSGTCPVCGHAGVKP